jgi:hypothetical protein
MTDSQRGYYISDKEIDKLSPEEFRRRINVLARVVNEQTNPSKTTGSDKIYYKSFAKVLDVWNASANVRYAQSNDKKDLDAREIINKARGNYDVFQTSDGVEIQLDEGDVLNFKDPGLPPVQKTKFRGGKTKTQQRREDAPKGAGTGETYNVTKEPTTQSQTTQAPKQDRYNDNDLGRKEATLRNMSMIEVAQNYKKSTDKVDKEASVNVALEKAKRLGNQEDATTLEGATDEFIEDATYDQLEKELQEIKIAIDLLVQADKDRVVPFAEARTQEAMLEKIKDKIEQAEKYKAGPQTMRVEDGEPGPTPPLRSAPEEPQPERVEPESTESAPQGTVTDIPLSGSDLIQEARNYIAEINKIPAFRLSSEMLNLRKDLQDAVKEPIEQKKLRDAVQKARLFFSNLDQNLNRIPDRSEAAGRAIDQGLDDMKKIEEQNRQAEEAKTKLTDLRPEAKEGEEERVKKNFNKDVLELKEANDVLKSKVNLQREEIKVLKETIEQKLAKENQEMLAGIAPVFRNYLSLDIENVVQEDEAQEEVYYSVI